MFDRNIKSILYTQEVEHFLDSLDIKARAKVVYNVERVLESSAIDSELFKKLDNDIWEFRTLYSKIQYRLLSFWCPKTNSLIIATHGFIKKTQKTPKKEIARAREIRRIYLESI
ncbi:type II toxin-antitoxin system RelE/ParE family toxin [Myroides sp. N17-2]|uniref:type II toxin-antitoxin system RelE/ParE family toxin n=1 Tax=Myroides sp. N17-2 TaxID=2030799 RepID=UPI000EFC9D6D|nr:type II toxin-antitoxin system RelE/ParE family toxin [Myroides sp. N17-2]